VLAPSVSSSGSNVASVDKTDGTAGKIFQPIRIALTGGTVSEPVNELLYVVGKEAALKRLQDAAAGSNPG